MPEQFKPSPDCETRESCKLFGGGGKCFRAHTINQELRYRERGMKSNLEQVIKNAKCTHPQVAEAIEAAKPFFTNI